MPETKQDTTYNGWPNYETWNVMLWMDNDEPAYRFYRARVEYWKSQGKAYTAGKARWAVMQCFGDKTPDGVKLGSSKIKWGRIAEAMREQ